MNIILFVVIIIFFKTCDACEKPKVWGVNNYDVIFSRPIMASTGSGDFTQIFFAFGRWHTLTANRILNHGEDFSGFLNKNTAKYAGQLTTFVPIRKVENVEILGYFTDGGTFAGTIYAPSDDIYMEEVPAVVRKAGWGVAATAIVYKESETPDFLAISPNGDETQWRHPKLPDLGPITELGAVDKVATIRKGATTKNVNHRMWRDDLSEFTSTSTAPTCKVLSVFDVSTYKQLLAIHGSEKKVKEELSKLLEDHFQADINYLYSAAVREKLISKVRFEFSDLKLLTDSKSLPWVDHANTILGGHGQLEVFAKKQWSSKYCLGLLFTYRPRLPRHGISYVEGACFRGTTRHDPKTNKEINSGNVGLINMSWGDKMVEDEDLSYTVRHEITHLLGSYHDNSTCSVGGPYLMHNGEIDRGIGRWRASKCSWAAVRQHLLTEDFKNCLITP